MLRHLIIKSYYAFLLVSLTLSFSDSATAQKNANKQEWMPLFNGKDINDWVVKIYHHDVGEDTANTFRVEDGIIKVRYDKYDKFNQQYGHLYYKQPFSYYHLKFEYRVTGEWRKDAPSYTIGNSGVMFHSQDPKTMPKEQDWPISVEYQILAGLDDGKPRPTGNMCSPGTDVVYKGKIDPRHCIESSSKTYPPDVWVKGEIIVLGDSLVTHVVNGDTVLQYSKPQIGGGVVNNFNPAIKKDGKLLSEGFIALQSEGQPVDFQNIEILNLEGCMDPASKDYRSYYIKSNPAKCK
ncbi:MAG: 3-keto-disaccharide hydrolase [Segetibacter sp.]